MNMGMNMAKSLIRQRREAKAVCPSCKEPDYGFKEWGVTKPIFVCYNCDYEWTSGYDGGVWADCLGHMIPNPPKEVLEMQRR